MRKILITLCVFFSFAASAQQLQYVNTYGYDYNKFKVRDLFGLPADTFAVPSSLLSVPFIANKSGTIYTWNITTHVWDEFTSGGSTYTASRGLNLSGTDFRLGGSIDSTVVLTVNNHSFTINKTTTAHAFLFNTLDTVTGGGAGLPAAGLSHTRILQWPSYSSTGYTLGSAFTLRMQIKDSAALNTQGGDFGQSLRGSFVFEKMAGYSGRSVYLLGNGSTLAEGLQVTINDATFAGTSTTSDYKYAKGWMIGNSSYLVIPTNDTLENWVGFYTKGFPTGHIKSTYDYIGGFFGDMTAARSPNPWSFVSYSARSKNWFAGPTGFGDSTIHASALIDGSSTTKGILIPRMTTAQRDAIVSPATSLLIFDTDLNGYYFWDGAAWTTLGGGLTNPMTTSGSIIIGGVAGTPTELMAGTNAYVLTSNGAGVAPSWQVSATGSALAGLSDVAITDQKKGQGIMYDSTLGKYVNASLNDQNKRIYSYWDDFQNNITGSRFIVRVSGTGAAVTFATANQYTSTVKRPGLISMSTGTTAVGYAGIDMHTLAQNTVVFKPNDHYGDVRFETSFQFDNISTAAEEYVFYTGIGADGRTGQPANSIHFEYDRATTGDFWVLVTTTASSRSVVVTTTPVTQDAWVRLEIRLNADATAVTGFIDGTEVVASSGTYPIVSNIYNGAAITTTAPVVIIRKTVGLTAYKCFVDYAGFQQIISGNR